MGHAGVAQVSRKRGEGVLDVRTFLIPAQQPPTGEGVPEVMNPGPAFSGTDRPRQLLAQFPEDDSHSRQRQGRAAAGEKECLGRRARVEAVPEVGVVVQGARGGRVKRGSRSRAQIAAQLRGL